MNCEWNRLGSQTLGTLGHSNVGIKKFSYVLLSLSLFLIQKYLHVASVLTSASNTWPRPRGSGLDLGLKSKSHLLHSGSHEAGLVTR